MSAPRFVYAAWMCRAVGHRWGEWYDCLRPRLRARQCSRCSAREIIEYRSPDGYPMVVSYEDTDAR